MCCAAFLILQRPDRSQARTTHKQPEESLKIHKFYWLSSWARKSLRAYFDIRRWMWRRSRDLRHSFSSRDEYFIHKMFVVQRKQIFNFLCNFFLFSQLLSLFVFFFRWACETPDDDELKVWISCKFFSATLAPSSVSDFDSNSSQLAQCHFDILTSNIRRVRQTIKFHTRS